MAYIKVTLAHTIKNGSKVSFKAPCDCHTVDGIKVYFPTEQGVATNQAFAFTDAHGNDLTGVGNLFKTGAIVKAILNLDESKAYLQNADTNKYLEEKFSGKADLVEGKVPTTQLPEMDYIPTQDKGAAGGVAELDNTGKVPTSQIPSPTYVTATMAAANWSGSTYSFEADYPSAEYDIEVSVADTATAEQFEAAGAAYIGSSATSNVFTAKGDVPTVDIPVIVKVVAK